MPEQSNFESNEEREIMPEEILRQLEWAIENGLERMLTVKNADGSTTANPAFPIAIEGNYLTIEADGYGFDIEVNRILKVEPVEQLEAISPDEAIEQIPTLKEMLAEKEEVLSKTTDSAEIENLKTEIEELRAEIEAREEMEQ